MSNRNFDLNFKILPHVCQIGQGHLCGIQGQGHYFCDLTCDLNSSRRDLYGDILLFAVAPLMRSQIEVKV